MLGLQVSTTVSDFALFFVKVGDLNSCLYTCMACTLLAEPSPHSLVINFNTLLNSYHMQCGMLTAGNNLQLIVRSE